MNAEEYSHENNDNGFLQVLEAPNDLGESSSGGSSRKSISANVTNLCKVPNQLQNTYSSKKRNLQPVNRGGLRVKGSTVSHSSNASNSQHTVNPFTQRVMSAKMLRVKQLQNQLTETQNQLNELVNENRLLRTLQKRQATALQRFEGSQDQLPQLIRSHNEEIRVLNSKIKQIKERCTDLENKLKRRDFEYTNLKEHHKHLLKLSQDKQLFDREKLAKRVEALELKETEQQEKIQLLNRKLELEGKNYRHQLAVQTNKLKETQNDLKSALGTINSLKAALEAKEKYVNASLPKRYSQSVEQIMQPTHVSLPVPPRVSIRQPQKIIAKPEINPNDSSSDSDTSFGEKYVPNQKDTDSSSGHNDEEGAEGAQFWSITKMRLKSSSSDELRLGRRSDESDEGRRRLFTSLRGKEVNGNAISEVARLPGRLNGRPPNAGERRRSRSGVREHLPPATPAAKETLLSKVPSRESLGSLGGPRPGRRGSVEALRGPVRPLEAFSGDMRRDIDIIRARDLALDIVDISHEQDEPKESILPSNDIGRFTNMTWDEIQREVSLNKMRVAEVSGEELSPRLPLNEQQKSNLLRMLNEIDDEENGDTGNDARTFEINEVFSEAIISSELIQNDDDATSKTNLMKELFG